MIALATSLLSALAVLQVAVDGTYEQARLIAETLFYQTRSAILDEGGQDLRVGLARATSLRSYAQAIIGYSDTTLYLAIVDRDGVAIFHSDPLQEGKVLAQPESLDEFVAQPAVLQLWQLRGNRVLGLDLPFSVDGEKKFGSVRVSLSTLLIAEEVRGVLYRNMMLAGAVVVTVFAVSFIVANRLLAPIERLRQEIRQIDLGDYHAPPDLDSDPDFSRLAEFFGTVGRRLRNDRELRESNREWLETMLGALDYAVLVVQQDGRIVSLNTAAVELLGNPEVTPDLRLDDVLCHGHPLRDLIEEALASGAPLAPRQIDVNIGTRNVAHEFTLRPIEGLQPGGVIVTGRNLERIRRLGSHLSYTQKLAALGRLTSGVAHEVRNPLNAMVLHAALLKEKIDDPAARDHLDVLERETRRLETVVDGFLKFTRPEEVNFGPVSVSEWVNTALSAVRPRLERNGVVVECDISPSLSPVRGDPGLLMQALENLLLNAEDALRKGDTLKISARAEAGMIQVLVADTGEGISPSDLPKIFDLFFTTKAKGAGIGLSLTYRIVELHGGRVEADSEPGKGTTFTVELPEGRA